MTGKSDWIDEVPDEFGEAEVGGTVLSCNQRATPAPPPSSHWIEIELVGEDDAPFVGERYRIVLSDGRVLEGVLGPKGVVRIEGLAAEPCSIDFPRLDHEAWVPADQVGLPSSV